MKKFIPLLVMLLGVQVAFAKHYITGAPKVTFRTGPGTDNKIMGMLEMDERVTLLEEGETWSKVKSKEGKEGFVMNRFLTQTIPYSVKYNWLLSQHKKLKDQLSELKEEKASLDENLGETKRMLASTKENLQATSQDFAELKAGSAEYLELKKKFDETSNKLSGTNKQVALLKEKLSLYYFTWFLAGAGVLFLGWLIGFFSRKKKRGYGRSITL